MGDGNSARFVPETTDAMAGSRAIDDSRTRPHPDAGSTDDLGTTLAVSIGDAWRYRIDATTEPLSKLQREIGTKYLRVQEPQVRELVANLQEFLRGRTSELADELFSGDFVRQSYAEIGAIVANHLPNDVAETYDFDTLRRLLREPMDDFATAARSDVAKAGRNFRKLSDDLLRNRRKGILTAMGVAMGMDPSATSKDKRGAVEFAQRRIELSADQIRQRAEVTAHALVEAALALLQTE